MAKKKPTSSTPKKSTASERHLPTPRPLWPWPRPRPASDPPRPRFLDDMIAKKEGTAR